MEFWRVHGRYSRDRRRDIFLQWFAVFSAVPFLFFVVQNSESADIVDCFCGNRDRCRRENAANIEGYCSLRESLRCLEIGDFVVLQLNPVALRLLAVSPPDRRVV